MLKEKVQSATITLRLSPDLSTDEEFSALRAAGIPVDEVGIVKFGYLFVRTRHGLNRLNIFRWFAPDSGKK